MSTASVTVTPSQRAFVELLAEGWLAPLDGFMGGAAADAVERTGRLPGAGGPCPCAVTLLVPQAALPVELRSAAGSDRAPAGWELELSDADGTRLGRLRVEDVVAREGHVQVGGRLSDVQLPARADFAELRGGPEALARRLGGRDDGGAPRSGGRSPLLVHQPRHFLPLSLEAGLRAVADRLGASVLLQVLVVPRDEQPLAHFARVQAICASAHAIDAARAHVSVLDTPDTLDAPAARRLRTWLAARAGATHVVAAPAPDRLTGGTGGVDDEWDRALAAELGLELVEVPELAALQLLEAALAGGASLPDGAVSPRVQRALTRAWPPRPARGFTVFLTGLSGAGKSTIARHLRARLMERLGREVTLLDGDLVRRHLSSELGFTREHRDLNIRRIGFVAAEVTRHRGIAICAPIAPYDAARREVRQMVEAVGGFVLVHVAAPVEVCEARDTKGLYARARAGDVPHFTGVSDPYEIPADAEVVIDTARLTPRDACDAILHHLEQAGLVSPETPA